MSSGSQSSEKGVGKVGPSKSSQVHSKVGSSSFTGGVSSPNVGVAKVEKSLGGSPALKGNTPPRREQGVLEGSAGTVPLRGGAESIPVTNDALGFREFRKKSFSKGSFFKIPRDNNTELEGTDVEDCGSSQARGDPVSSSSRKDSLPNVSRFASNVESTPKGNVFVPPYPLDKTRSYFCSPEHAYGVSFDIITPADKERFRSLDLKGACSEGLHRGYQVMFTR